MVIGQIDYSVSDSGGRVLDQGRRIVNPGDITSTEIEGKDMVLITKSILLGHEFHFSFVDGPNSATAGFGLTGSRLGERCFGWDWFNIQSPGVAKKLQETGLLHFEVVGESIGRMEFAQDVSLRIHRFSELIVSSPDWRIHITAGSWINWLG